MRNESTRKKCAHAVRVSLITSVKRRCSITVNPNPRRTTLSARYVLNWEKSKRGLGLLAQVDKGLAQAVADGLGIAVPKKLDKPLNMSIPAGADPRKLQPKRALQDVESSPALSQIENPNFPKDTIKTRKVAVLLADGFDDGEVAEMNKALLTAGAVPKTVAPHLGVIAGADGSDIKADFSFLTGSSVLFDAIFVPGGEASIEALSAEAAASEFVSEAYKHCKAIAATGAGVDFVQQALVAAYKTDEDQEGVITDRGVSIAETATAFIEAIAAHRHWSRETASSR